MLKILPFTLGPVQTNAYLIADEDTREAVVIDPAWDGKLLFEEANRRNWNLTAIWITHPHFDHIGGVAALAKLAQPSLAIALYPEDIPLWQNKGGASLFGILIQTPPDPKISLSHNQTLPLGGYQFEVRHTPGHTPGHVVFYCAKEGVVFCGDLIFAGSIGRTDLPGGDFNTLIHSIRSQILSLPDKTRLLSGHGPETTVGLEKRNNPFLK